MDVSRHEAAGIMRLSNFVIIAPGRAYRVIFLTVLATGDLDVLARHDVNGQGIGVVSR